MSHGPFFVFKLLRPKKYLLTIFKCFVVDKWKGQGEQKHCALEEKFPIDCILSASDHRSKRAFKFSFRKVKIM